MKCYFSTDITEEISCSQDGEFDSNGFPTHTCPQYPCAKYKKLQQEIDSKRDNRK